MAKNIFTDSQVIDQLTSGSRWYGSNVTYGFPKAASNIYGGAGEKTGFSPLDSTQITAAELAILAWDDLIQTDFLPSTTSYSDVEFGNTTSGIEYAHAYTPNLGSVWFSALYDSLRTPIVGDTGFETYIHELGHAIGLDHMGNYNGTEISSPSSWQDSLVYTIMSYFGPNTSLGGEGRVAWADWTGLDGVDYLPQTPMINDVMAIQSFYGLESIREDNTTYGFASSIRGKAAALYDFSRNENPILCIYDSNGIDTLDLSGWQAPSIVDLIGGPDHFSSGNGMTRNIQIARGVVIENAVTGTGNDQITGNAAANLLRGNAGQDTINGLAGNDSLSGGAGNDTVNGGDGIDSISFSGKRSNYDFSYDIVDKRYIVEDKVGTDGVDVVSAVELAKFSDMSSELPFLVSSVVYRFYNTETGVHFYTGSSSEARTVKQSSENFVFEDIVFNTATGRGANVVDIYRFYNTHTGSHFYTASPKEADYVRSTLKEFKEDGVAFQAYTQGAEGLSPLYRFYNTYTGTHFYTASSAEKDQVMATLTGTMSYDGVAFYVDL